MLLCKKKKKEKLISELRMSSKNLPITQPLFLLQGLCRVHTHTMHTTQTESKKKESFSVSHVISLCGIQ